MVSFFSSSLPRVANEDEWLEKATRGGGSFFSQAQDFLLRMPLVFFAQKLYLFLAVEEEFQYSIFSHHARVYCIAREVSIKRFLYI